MTKDNIYIGAEAREGIIRGIKRCADAVGGTMGTGGNNAILECIEYPGQYTTNDGATILESIRFADPLEDMGRNILLEAVKRANRQSGDGSSTTTVLTAAIIQEGIKHLNDASPMTIKRSLEACIPVLEKAINDQKKEITVDDVAQVATISAEDESIGAMIQKIYQEIGKDGIIHWDIAKGFEDYYTIGKGITIDQCGFASPHMADLDEKTGSFLNHAKWKNAHILITKQKITSASDLSALFETMFNKEIKEVVVFCDEFEANVVMDLILTRVKRGFRTVLVKMPVIWKDHWFTDLAKVTGATVIDPAAGITFKTMNMSHLGKVDHITVTKDTVFIDGMKDITEHIEQLKELGDDDSLLRVSRLNTQTARYFVGAASDGALAYRRLKVEDAINAAYQALQFGVVAGGGVALRDARASLGDDVGSNILIASLTAPYYKIIDNSGFKLDETILDRSLGINSRTGEIVNMFDAGIVDPSQVVINAARNAISVAASVLTCGTIVLLPKEQTK